MTNLLFHLDLRHTSNRRIPVELEWTLPPAPQELRLSPPDSPQGSPREPARPGSDPSADRAPPSPWGTLFFPAWTPGSYLIREYARQISGLEAEDLASGEPVALRQIAKNRWQLEDPSLRRVRVRYSVYAHELTVRTADVDGSHAYWNGACVYMWPLDREQESAEIQVRLPSGWELATQLPRAARSDSLAPGNDGAVVALCAGSLHEAIDAPCLAGELTRVPFEVMGIPHEFVFWGLDGVALPERVIPDSQKLVEQAAQVFGDGLPYDRYTFLSLHADQGGGGLEHTHSSTLLAPRTTFRPGKPYRGFMGLVAHEHFHVWNVKRMRPAGLWAIDYERECDTELLWVAEGFTAYYDDLLCLRAGVHSPTSYLTGVAESIQGLASNPGRLRLSLTGSGRDAWIRLYRADEDTRNTSQNYYTNGALAAMVLDLTIRRETDGARSLDDALRQLWQTTWKAGRGYTRADIDRCVGEAAGADLRSLIGGLVDGPFDPSLRPLLEAFGLTWTETPAADKGFLGISFRSGTTVITNVVADGPADAAGLCPQDEVLAIQGLRADSGSWEAVLDTVAAPDRPVEILLARRGKVLSLQVTPGTPPPALALGLDGSPSPAQLALRQGWLGS